MATYLKNLKINTLGSVDTPANQFGQAVLLKRGDGQGDTQIATSGTVAKSNEHVVPENFMDKIHDMVAKALDKVLKPEQMIQKSAKDLYSQLHEDWIWSFLCDTFWDINYAFRESVESILLDTSVEDKRAAVELVCQQYVDILAQYDVFQNYGIVKSADSKVYVEQVLKSFGEKDKLPEDIKTAIAELDVTKALPKGDDDMSGQTNTSVQDILAKNANLPAEVVEALKKSAQLEQQVGDLATQVELEKAARLDREYLSKAAQYTNLPNVGEKFHEVLKGLGTKAPEEFAQLETILTAANEAIGKSALFTEVGAGAGAATGTTAWEEVEKRAVEMVTKNAGMTKEMATQRILETDAELYKRYRRGE